jgi:hypothetical protein
MDDINDDFHDEENTEVYSSSRDICYKCLTESFSEESKIDLLNQIKNKFSRETSILFSKEQRIDVIIYNIIDKCYEHADFDSFWSIIEGIRSNRWRIFFKQWEDAYKKEQEDGNAKSYKENKEEILKHQTPASGEDKDVSSWFFNTNTLNCSQQSMVITTALFQGVEKNKFNDLVLGIQKCLFPAVVYKQILQKNPPSEGQSEDDNENKDVEVSPELEDEQEHFKAAKIKIVSSGIYKEYGKTNVDIVIFDKQEYRNEVLKLLRFNISIKKKEIFNYICNLGTYENREERSCAVNAVAALTETDNFNELVEGIIKEWANSSNTFAQKSAAESLAAVLIERRNEKEIFNLLNSWINKNNGKLVAARLLTYFFIADLFPEEAMKAIESAVYSDPDHLSMKLKDIAVKVYNNEKKIFISYVRNWTGGDSDALRQLAGAWFLRFVRLKDAAADQNSEKQIVEIISALWKDSQFDTAAKVKEWAEETLSAFENGKPELFATGQKLFHQLYPNCRKKLDYYLPKWQGYRDYAQKRAAERGKSSASQRSGKQANFSMLMPKEA